MSVGFADPGLEAISVRYMRMYGPDTADWPLDQFNAEIAAYGKAGGGFIEGPERDALQKIIDPNVNLAVVNPVLAGAEVVLPGPGSGYGEDPQLGGNIAKGVGYGEDPQLGGNIAKGVGFGEDFQAGADITKTLPLAVDYREDYDQPAPFNFVGYVEDYDQPVGGMWEPNWFQKNILRMEPMPLSEYERKLADPEIMKAGGGGVTTGIQAAIAAMPLASTLISGLAGTPASGGTMTTNWVQQALGLAASPVGQQLLGAVGAATGVKTGGTLGGTIIERGKGMMKVRTVTGKIVTVKIRKHRRYGRRRSGGMGMNMGQIMKMATQARLMRMVMGSIGGK